MGSCTTTRRVSLFYTLKRRFLVAFSALALIPVTLLAGAGTASASASNGLPYVTSFSDLFSSPNPYSNFNGGAFSGETVSMICWTDSAWSLGTNRWFYVAVGIGVAPDGALAPIAGYVQATRVANQATVRHC
jgi:hypothetical protein